jgi:predicted ATPase/DNA-binding CsgD family transcriptional regulator
MAATSGRNAHGSGGVKHNLAAPLTALIGRSRELDGVADSLRRTRLVTLTGPGGVGKTRLALELAWREASRRQSEVRLVDLTAGPETLDVAGEAARVLGVGAAADTSADTALRRHLANRELLLVLDNCEHVIDACAELVAVLLGACPELRVLATSREALSISGETVWRLEPLGRDEARRLFVERARQRRPEFVPDDQAETMIDVLCARLDRLPLAIELAAARVGVLSLAEILAGLEVRLDELEASTRLAPERHRTLPAAVRWSYQLLEPSEQRALRALAVFVGGFDAAAARAVGVELDVLARLVEKSLVAVVESTSGHTRYRLLETVREFGLARLTEEDELADARGRHLGYFRSLGQASEDGWPTIHAAEFVNQLHDDYENVRAALEWAATSDPCAARPVLAGMKDIFIMLGEPDGRRLTRLLLERCETRDADRARLLITAGVLAMLVGEGATAADALGEAMRLGAELGEPALEGWALAFLGLTETLSGRIDPAREHLEASRAIHHQLGIQNGWARATAPLGLSYSMTDEPERARELVEEALAANVATGDHWGQGQCHLYLGLIAESSGTAPDRESVHYRATVEHMREFRGGPLLPVALVGQAGVLVASDPGRAVRVLAAAHSLRERTGGRFAPLFAELVGRVRARAEAAAGPEAVGLWQQGARLSMDEAIALAFETEEPGRSASQPEVAGLSAREAEIARLVAQGLSNKAIAGRLHLSVRTVESHVRHALAKVGLRNRTELATWIRERVP